jgi:hypothetical protein
VKLVTAAASGVPVIAPVDAFSDAHDGREPETTLHVIGVSPDAVSVSA